MPELPEVETVVRNLNEILPRQRIILKAQHIGQSLRYNLTSKQQQQLRNQKILNIRRRAKYIVFELEKQLLISHLGMTGQWRWENESFDRSDFKKHDHFLLCFKKGYLVYNDPRRFGFLELISKDQEQDYFKGLGFEPDQIQKNLKEIVQMLKLQKTNLKTSLMNQKVIVGVGNIYASEALFLAGLNPLKLALKTSDKQLELLVLSSLKLMNKAIQSGGSSVQNYLNSKNEKGSFQNQLKVYGREGLGCKECGEKIRSIVIQQRSSFFCPRCQKKSS